RVRVEPEIAPWVDRDGVEPRLDRVRRTRGPIGTACPQIERLAHIAEQVLENDLSGVPRNVERANDGGPRCRDRVRVRGRTAPRSGYQVDPSKSRHRAGRIRGSCGRDLDLDADVVTGLDCRLLTEGEARAVAISRSRDADVEAFDEPTMGDPHPSGADPVHHGDVVTAGRAHNGPAVGAGPEV